MPSKRHLSSPKNVVLAIEEVGIYVKDSFDFNGAQFRTLDEDWRGVLGVRAGTDGVLVNEVAAGSAAAAAGLKSGDVVLSVDGTTATSPLVVARLLSLTDANQSTLRVWRARDTRTVTIRRNAERAPRP